jgi:hypothetical protein
MSRATPQARELLAAAIQAGGPEWRNAADSVRSGSWGNVWTAAALVAIDKALRTEPDSDDDT